MVVSSMKERDDVVGIGTRLTVTQLLVRVSKVFPVSQVACSLTATGMQEVRKKRQKNKIEKLKLPLPSIPIFTLGFLFLTIDILSMVSPFS